MQKNVKKSLRLLLKKSLKKSQKMTFRKQKKHSISSEFFFLDTIGNYFDFATALKPLEFQTELRFSMSEKHKKTCPLNFKVL